MTEGVVAMTIQEAFAAAEAEQSQAGDGAESEGLPPSAPQAPSADEPATAPIVDGDQTPTGTVDELLSSLGVTPTAAPDPSSPDFWALEVEVTTDEGPQRMTLDEMRQGTMMRADYTRKTQELSRNRALLAESADFHQAFKADPQGFAKFLATKAGLIESDGTTVSGVKLFTEDEVSGLVTERLNKALEEHPDVVKARASTAVQAVDAVFEQLESTYGPISRENRLKVLETAQRRGTGDVALVFESMLLHASQQAAARNVARGAASKQPGGTPSQEPAPQPPGPMSVEAAWQLAEKEFAGTVA